MPVFAPVQPQYLDLAGAMESAERIKASRQAQMYNAQRMQQAQQEQQQAQSLRDLLSRPGFNMQDPESIRQVMATSPELGMRFMEAGTAQQNAQAKTQEQQHELAGRVASAAMNEWDLTGRDPTQFQKIVAPKVQFLVQQGLDMPPETITPESVESVARGFGSYVPQQEKLQQMQTAKQAELDVTMPAQIEMERQKQEAKARYSPPRAPIQTPEQIVKLEQEKARARETGKAAGKAEAELPTIEQDAEMILTVAKQLKEHPGLPDVIGLPWAGGIPKLIGRGPVWNTQAAGFEALREQLGGQAFLQAFNKLTGQITEAEGTKATLALARLQTSQSETEFKKALDDLEAAVKSGVTKAKQKAGKSISKFDELSQEQQQQAIRIREEYNASAKTEQDRAIAKQKLDALRSGVQ